MLNNKQKDRLFDTGFSFMHNEDYQQALLCGQTLYVQIEEEVNLLLHIKGTDLYREPFWKEKIDKKLKYLKKHLEHIGKGNNNLIKLIEIDQIPQSKLN